MTVYIEYVLLDNIIIDYLLLKATFAITCKKVSRGRLFLCAVLGAVIALIYPLIETVAIILTAIKLLGGLLIVLLSACFDGAKDFYVSLVLFYLLTFVSGGAITGVFNLLNLSPSKEISVAVMFLPVYVVIKSIISVVKFLYRKKNIISNVIKVEMTLFNNTISALGFMDTGNCLTDGLEPVIVISKKAFDALSGENLLKIKFKSLEINSVNAVSNVLSFKIDCLSLYFTEMPNIYNNVRACVAPNGTGNGYDVILHPAFMENKDGTKVFMPDKKVS